MCIKNNISESQYFFYHLTTEDGSALARSEGLHPSERDLCLFDEIDLPCLNIFRTIAEIEDSLMNGLGDELSSIYGSSLKLSIVVIKLTTDISSVGKIPTCYRSSIGREKIIGCFSESEISDYLTLEKHGTVIFC